MCLIAHLRLLFWKRPKEGDSNDLLNSVSHAADLIKKIPALPVTHASQVSQDLCPQILRGVRGKRGANKNSIYNRQRKLKRGTHRLELFCWKKHRVYRLLSRTKFTKWRWYFWNEGKRLQSFSSMNKTVSQRCLPTARTSKSGYRNTQKAIPISVS